MEDLIKEERIRYLGFFLPSATAIHCHSPKKKQHFLSPNKENRPNTLIPMNNFGAQFLYSACKPSSATYTYYCLQKDKN